MLAGAAVDVVWSDPAELGDPARRAAAASLLTAEERARIDRLLRPEDRLLHLAARALLRRALSRHGPLDPGAWRFVAGEGGRPELEPHQAGLRFSVTHTRGLAAVAVADELKLGLDVEAVPDAVPWEVVKRFLAPGERAALCAVSHAEAPARFAAIWTLKEAYAKARGLGLALPFDGFTVQVSPPRLEATDAARWRLAVLDLGTAHRTALCVEAGEAPLRISVGRLPA